MKRGTPFLVLVGLLLLVGAAIAQTSPNYDLSWHVVAGGGMKVASSGHAVQSTVGQFAIGPGASTHTLDTGYWYGGPRAAGVHRVYLPIVLLAPQWNPQAVDNGVSGQSLALDAAGRPHIAYANSGGLVYASYDGTTWLTATVVSSCRSSPEVSLALDSADRPHVACRDGVVDGGALVYAYFDGSSWIPTIVADSSTYFYDFAGNLALDSADRPHVSYWSCTYYWPPSPSLCVGVGLRYAWYDGAAWQYEMVDPGLLFNNRSNASLVLDTADFPHIGGHCTSSGRVDYVYRDATGWHTEVVDDAAYEGVWSSLALDTAGRPHLAYTFDWLEHTLRYARYDGSAWITTTVVAPGVEPSLVLDAADRPHISYLDETDLAIKYASYDGVSWHLLTVDNPVDGGHDIALVLDTADRPHISWLTGQSLWYAHLER